MKFDYISPRVKGDLHFFCQEKLDRLLLEMGCRENNQHVGSGMGGNPSQLIVLMDMRHILGGDLFDSIRLDYNNREIIWGHRWLQDKCIRTIRNELTKQFQKLSDYLYANRAVDLAEAVGSKDIRAHVLNNRIKFPDVYACIVDWKYADKLSPTDQLLLAHSECQALAFDLDRGSLHNIENVGKLLSKLCPEAVLLAVRNHIQIERLVKHNLDEHPAWEAVLNKINNKVNSK